MALESTIGIASHRATPSTTTTTITASSMTSTAPCWCRVWFPISAANDQGEMGWMRASSGIADLDELLGGLIPGDNVVWVTTSQGVIVAIERSFLSEGLRR